MMVLPHKDRDKRLKQFSSLETVCPAGHFCRGTFIVSINIVTGQSQERFYAP